MLAMSTPTNFSCRRARPEEIVSMYAGLAIKKNLGTNHILLEKNLQRPEDIVIKREYETENAPSNSPLRQQCGVCTTKHFPSETSRSKKLTHALAWRAEPEEIVVKRGRMEGRALRGDIVEIEDARCRDPPHAIPGE